MAGLATLGHCHAHLAKARIHDVGAVAGTGHPSGHRFLGGFGTEGDVFAGQPGTIARAAHAILRFAAVGRAVFEVAVARHVARMGRGGAAQDLREDQWTGRRKVLASARTTERPGPVHQIQYALLYRGRICLGGQVGPRDRRCQEKDSQQQRFGVMSPDHRTSLHNRG